MPLRFPPRPSVLVRREKLLSDMPLEHNRYCFGVLLVYAVTAMTLPTGGWCEPTGHTSRPDSRPALLHESAGDYPTGGLALSGAERPQLDRRPAEDSVRFPSSFHNLENGTLSENETSALTPKPTMASTSRDKSFETRNKPKRSDPPNQDCDKGRIERLIPGKFYITGQLERNPSVGYQADSAASVQPPGGPQRIRGQQLSGSESWQRLQPEVQCGDDSMTLTVRRRRAVQLQLDRVNESSVPLSQLPPQCGYSIQTTWRDLSLMARYDACHVTQEDDRYTLHLLWRGTPVQMSCPATRIQPQAAGPSSLCCSPHGMTVKVQGLHAMEELSVNVRGEWTPLVELAEQCGYRLERQDADFIIAAPFITCGVTVKDGKYTLSLQMGEKTFTLACPVSPHEELSLTHQPVFNNPPHLTRGPAEHMPESLHPFPWAPPFYLAPPYYPHPTYYHKYPSPDEHTADISPTPSPSTPGPTFGPHPLPAVDSQPDYHNYYAYPIPIVESYTHFGVHGSLSSTGDAEDSDWVSQAPSESPLPGVSKRHSSLSSNTDLPIQVESPPPLQPPSQAFNPYYHYYHHPKIPLPGPPQDPYPGPEVPREVSLTNPNNPENLVLPHNMDQSEALHRMNLQQFLQPVSHTLQTSPPKASALYTPHPAEPFPNYYSYYFPHIAQFEAIRLAPLNPDTAANLPDHQNSKTNDFVHPLPCPSQVHDGYNLNTIIDSQNTDKITVFQKNMPEGIKPPLNVDVKAELDARVAPAVQPPLRPTYPPGPAAVAAPLPEQPSFPTPSPKHNLPPYPYYYHPYYLYQMYYGTEGLLGADNPVSPTSSKEAVEHLPRASSSPTQHPSYTNPQTTTPTKPMYDVYNDPLHPYYYYYSYYNTPQHPYDAFGRHGGEKAEERLDDEMKDQLGAEPPTPSALGFGPASYIDCSVSLGCCLYAVKDCTIGQHFIFAMPDSVVEPAVAPPAHPSERSNVSCTLQKLTPDLYAVPLDGCGVSKHVFGQTVVHRLEVNGILSLQQDHSSEHENSPIRLMVECSSFPGFPGEVRLHVMDQPPPPPVPAPPATGTVLLRIATDESFTSFHPEAHLPLSLMRGRPIYVEVSLLDPPKPGLVLLVHSCLAFTQAPYASWMLVYDGCPRHGDSQLLPSPRSNPNHIRRFIISDFLSLHSESPLYMAEGGYSYLWDPEIYFLCLTELCSTADGDCTVGCINNPISGT